MIAADFLGLSWEERMIRFLIVSPALNSGPSVTFLSVPLAVYLGGRILHERKLCLDDMGRMGLIYSEDNPFYQFYNQKSMFKPMHVCF